MGKLSLIDLEQGYYIAKFELEEDFMCVISNGPWLINGQYLTVQQWRPEFDPNTNHHSSMAI